MSKNERSDVINRFIVLFLIFDVSLFAKIELKSEYEFQNSDINLSTIIPSVQKDATLFSVNANRRIYRVKTSELINIVSRHSNLELTSKHRYTQFSKKSPIDTTPLQEKIEKLYKNAYGSIDIKSVEISPRSYVQTLPKEYSFHMQERNLLKKSGIFSIKSTTNKQIFFNYKINASLIVYASRFKLKKGDPLSNTNLTYKKVKLGRFRAMPLQHFKENIYEAKHHIKESKIITIRDVSKLKMVKRGAVVHVVLHDNNMDISFSAEALEDGTYGEVIKAKQNDSKVIKIKITGKNRGKII